MQRFWIYIISIFSLAHGYEVPNYSASNRHITDPELTTLPSDLVRCYTDLQLWDRYHRLPSSVESLVALLRKIELHPAVQNWKPAKLAGNIIHKFRFDGIAYDRCIDTSSGALPLKLDLEAEVPKMQLIWQLIDGDRSEMPEDILEPEEKCALHWMLSYSVNTTFREEEYFVNDYYYQDYQNDFYDYQNDAPIPPNNFGVKNTGVIRENIEYNPSKPFYYNCDERYLNLNFRQ